MSTCVCLDDSARAVLADALPALFQLAENLGEPGEGPAPG